MKRKPVIDKTEWHRYNRHRKGAVLDGQPLSAINLC